MKVDYHVHLEEGPYSLRWWNRTAEALLSFRQPNEQKHTRAWMEQVSEWMQNRMNQGCYSQEWLDLYRIRAKQLGLAQVGIVDHLYRFKEFKPYFEQNMHVADDELGHMQQIWLDQVCTSSLDEFVTFIERQKRVWEADGLQLRLGIELDYFPGGEAVLAPLVEKYPWDHLIGSIHYVDGWGFDNPETVGRYEQADLLSMYDRLFDLVEQAIRSHLFDIIAHMDNMKVFGYRPDEAKLLPRYRRIAQLLKEHDTATEINTGLFYRYPVKEMCPSDDFLQVLHQYGVKMTTSSDAHFPDHLGSYLDDARKKLKQVGFQEIATFEKRVRQMVPLT